MIVLVASCYLAGIAIGLHLDIRATIMATVIDLLASLAAAIIGWVGPGQAIYGAFATIAALQSGYVSIVIVNVMGVVNTRENPLGDRIKPPSAVDNPSHR